MFLRLASLLRAALATVGLIVFTCVLYMPLPHPTPHATVRAAIRQGMWVGIATGLYGISFGALAVAAGLSVGQALLLSALLYTGGSQFALIGVLASGGTGAAAMAASTLLGLRNGFYGLQMARLLRPRGWRLLLAAQLTIDESTAVALAQPDQASARAGFWSTGLAVFVCWNLMTLLGAWLGHVLGDPRQWGLDAAAGAAFLALLWPRLGARHARLIALAAGAVALLVTPWAPPGTPILIAALVAMLAGWCGDGDAVVQLTDDAPDAAVPTPHVAQTGAGPVAEVTDAGSTGGLGAHADKAAGVGANMSASVNALAGGKLLPAALRPATGQASEGTREDVS